MSKQDRQGVRTPADLERKYKFGESFAEVMGIARDAQTAAEEAKKNSEDAASKLTPDEIFNLLTNNGALQGIYRGDDGEIYINASYIKGGMIISEGQAYLPPTYDDVMTMLWSLSYPTRYPPQDFYDLNGDGTFDRDDVFWANNVYLGLVDITECATAAKTNVTIIIEPDNPTETVKIVGTNMWGSEITMSLGVCSSKIPAISGDCTVGGRFAVGKHAIIQNLSVSAEETPKTLSWKDNGDGTFTLIGQ
jgi:hypothetical protein